MTIVSWDSAISTAHEGIREEMIRQVGRGEIYRDTRQFWYKRLPPGQRTSLYGYFPPIMDDTLDAILDELLENRIITLNVERGSAGLLLAELS